MVTVAVILALVGVMELVALALREIGASRDVADVVSLVAIVLIARRALSDFPPDERSLAWARSAPTRAAAVLGGTLALLLVGWFLLTEDDMGVALGAAGLGVLVSLGCAWMARREYARASG